MLTSIASLFALVTMLMSGVYGYVYFQKKQENIPLSPRTKAAFTSLIIIFGTASLLMTRY